MMQHWAPRYIRVKYVMASPLFLVTLNNDYHDLIASVE